MCFLEALCNKDKGSIKKPFLHFCFEGPLRGTTAILFGQDLKILKSHLQKQKKKSNCFPMYGMCYGVYDIYTLKNSELENFYWMSHTI